MMTWILSQIHQTQCHRLTSSHLPFPTSVNKKKKERTKENKLKNLTTINTPPSSKHTSAAAGVPTNNHLVLPGAQTARKITPSVSAAQPPSAASVRYTAPPRSSSSTPKVRRRFRRAPLM